MIAKTSPLSAPIWEPSHEIRDCKNATRSGLFRIRNPNENNSKNNKFDG